VNEFIDHLHHSELQIKVSQFTNHYTLSLLQSAVSSTAVPWQRLLTVEMVEIIQLDALRFNLYSFGSQLTTPELDCRSSTELVAQIIFFITPRRGDIVVCKDLIMVLREFKPLKQLR
jgi:hypothetical protein